MLSEQSLRGPVRLGDGGADRRDGVLVAPVGVGGGVPGGVPSGPAFPAGREGGEAAQAGVGDPGRCPPSPYRRWPAGGPAVAADVAEQGRRADLDGEVGCQAVEAVVQADGHRRAGSVRPWPAGLNPERHANGACSDKKHVLNEWLTC